MLRAIDLLFDSNYVMENLSLSNYTDQLKA